MGPGPGDERGGADAADEGEAEEPVTRGQLFVRLPVPVRVPELSDAMRLALQWFGGAGGSAVE